MGSRYMILQIVVIELVTPHPILSSRIFEYLASTLQVAGIPHFGASQSGLVLTSRIVL